MLIMPDTNVLYSDPFLERSLIKTILAAEYDTDIRLVLTEVVVDELRNHVEERFEKTAKAANAVRRDYADLSGADFDQVEFAIDPDQKRAVLDRFDRRIAQLDQEGRILGYPSPSPKELANRSIKVQLPFRESDRGMRDTLIWLTAKGHLINHASASHKIVLITNDGAFWDKDDEQMQEELARELDRDGIPPDSITVLPSLQKVVETFVTGDRKLAEQVKVAIATGEIDDFLASSDTVLLKAVDWIHDHFEMLDVSDYIVVEFDIVEKAEFQSVERAFDLGCGQAIVETKWTSDVVAEGYYSRRFGDNLRLELQFKLSSVINIDDRFSVESHEIIEMVVVDIIQTEQGVWLSEL